MKVALALIGVLTVLLVACGGDGPTIAQPSAPDSGGGNEGQAISTDVGERAPEGQAILEVDGKTFTSTIGECSFQETGSFVIVAAPGDEQVGVNATRVGDQWAINSGVTLATGETYLASSAGGADVAIDGQSVSFTVDYGRIDDSGMADVGSGRLSATCPQAAAQTVSGDEPTGPNTIRIGDQVWTRIVEEDVGQCFVQEATQGLQESASVWGYVDENQTQRFSVNLNNGEVQADVNGATYYWVAGARNSEVNDLELELDFASQTIKGSGTFTNAFDGKSEPGSFEFTCE